MRGFWERIFKPLNICGQGISEQLVRLDKFEYFRPTNDTEVQPMIHDLFRVTAVNYYIRFWRMLSGSGKLYF